MWNNLGRAGRQYGSAQMTGLASLCCKALQLYRQPWLQTWLK